MPAGSAWLAALAGLAAFAAMHGGAPVMAQAPTEPMTEAALDEHGGPVKGVAVSADGNRALTASFDYSVILWDLRKREPLAHLYGHEAAVNDVAFLQDGRAISASDDGTLAIWDLAGARRLARLSGHSGKVAALAIAPDGRRAASAGWDRTVRVWDLATGTQVQELSAQDNVNALQYSPDGARILAGNSDGSIQIWRAADGNQLAVLNGHDFAVTALDVSADGRLAASASVEETVQLWDLEQGAPTLTLYGHAGPVLAVALSADRELVASGGIDGTVRVWRRGDGDRLRVYQRHGGAVWSVAFTPDGKTLLSGGADGLVVSHRLDRHPEASEVAAAAIEEASPEAAGRGAELFRKCVACHTVTPDGGHKAGPTLHGLFGRVAGSHPGYPYSAALRESELVWTAKTIDRLFDVGPEVLVPGSKMPLQRMPDAKDRALLIAYLKQVTAAAGRDYNER
jgi:cytochrome c